MQKDSGLLGRTFWQCYQNSVLQFQRNVLRKILHIRGKTVVFYIFSGREEIYFVLFAKNLSQWFQNCILDAHMTILSKRKLFAKVFSSFLDIERKRIWLLRLIYFFRCDSQNYTQFSQKNFSRESIFVWKILFLINFGFWAPKTPVTFSSFWRGCRYCIQCVLKNNLS